MLRKLVGVCVALRIRKSISVVCGIEDDFLFVSRSQIEGARVICLFASYSCAIWCVYYKRFGI